MLQKSPNGAEAAWQANAPVFAALGDETRLSLVIKLGLGNPLSITQLTQGSGLTRQAVTKHLRVLETVGIARAVRSGRESLFEFDPQPVVEMQRYLAQISEDWDRRLARLKSFVEDKLAEREGQDGN